MKKDTYFYLYSISLNTTLRLINNLKTFLFIIFFVISFAGLAVQPSLKLDEWQEDMSNVYITGYGQSPENRNFELLINLRIKIIAPADLTKQMNATTNNEQAHYLIDPVHLRSTLLKMASRYDDLDKQHSRLCPQCQISITKIVVEALRQEAILIDNDFKVRVTYDYPLCKPGGACPKFDWFVFSQDNGQPKNLFYYRGTLAKAGQIDFLEMERRIPLRKLSSHYLSTLKEISQRKAVIDGKLITLNKQSDLSLPFELNSEDLLRETVPLNTFNGFSPELPQALNSNVDYQSRGSFTIKVNLHAFNVLGKNVKARDSKYEGIGTTLHKHGNFKSEKLEFPLLIKLEADCSKLKKVQACVLKN